MATKNTKTQAKRVRTNFVQEKEAIANPGVDTAASSEFDEAQAETSTAIASTASANPSAVDVDEIALRWLTNTPATDPNFKGSLDRANIPTIEAALAKVRELSPEGNKTKLKALEAKLKARLKEAAKEAEPEAAPPALPQKETEPDEPQPQMGCGFKFHIPQSELATQLPPIARIMGGSHPVLDNALITANEKTGKVTLLGFNLSMGIQVDIDADVEASGSFSIPAATFNDLIQRLPDEALSFEHNQETSEVIINSSVGRHVFNGRGAEEYPSLPEVEGEALILSGMGMATGINYCAFSVSRDPSKQVLTAIRLEIGPSGIEMASTDGHRLSIYNYTSAEERNEEIPEVKLNIPVEALRQLRNLMGKSWPNVLIRCGKEAEDNQFRTLVPDDFALFKLPNALLITSLNQAVYPNYQQLMPQSFCRKVVLDRQNLLRAAERVALFTDRGHKAIKLQLKQKQQTMKLEAHAEVGLGGESFPVKLEGGDLDIAFNSQYLAEVLSIMTAEEIQIEMNTSTAPCVITPVSAVPFRHLLMPVQIRSVE